MGKGVRQGVVERFDSLGAGDGHTMTRTVKEMGVLKDSKGLCHPRHNLETHNATRVIGANGPR
jgi:hypothetical protein